MANLIMITAEFSPKVWWKFSQKFFKALLKTSGSSVSVEFLSVAPEKDIDGKIFTQPELLAKT